MAAKHRAASKKAKAHRHAPRHRAPQQHADLATWIGAGALTVGFCASLGGVTGVANAAPASNESTHSTAESGGATSAAKSTGSARSHSGSAASKPKSTKFSRTSLGNRPGVDGQGGHHCHTIGGGQPDHLPRRGHGHTGACSRGRQDHGVGGGHPVLPTLPSLFPWTGRSATS